MEKIVILCISQSQNLNDMKYLLVFFLTLVTYFSCTKKCEDPQAECAELNKGLLAYYPFNGSFNDESGNGNNATAKNGAVLTSDFLGRTNKAAGFDGVNDYLIVPGSSKLDADAISVSFQVMVNNSNRRNVTVSRINFETGESVIFGVHESQPADNKWNFGVTPGTDDCTKQYPYDPTLGVYANPPIQAGRWYNVIVTFGAGKQNFYIDGVLHNSVTRTFSNAKKCPNGDLMIGGWWKNDIVSIDGKLDEVRLYNRVLTDCEIAKLSETFKGDN
jgi:hypothetical protein